MNNLVIGNTSQLSHYFPEEYEKISSRNIDFNSFKDKEYDRCYICFADQRTFIEDHEQNFIDINFTYTLKVIDFFKKICKKVVVYSTSELWNNVDRAVTIETPFFYNYTPYIYSKLLLSSFLIKNRLDYPNVIIIYPFNFNSVYRGKYFLFGKIFSSIINREKIEIGNIDFERDIIHPKIIVEKSITAEKDMIVGMGELINVKSFVIDLYKAFYMDYDKYVKENSVNNLSTIRKGYYSFEKSYTYENLFKDTVTDIESVIYKK